MYVKEFAPFLMFLKVLNNRHKDNKIMFAKNLQIILIQIEQLITKKSSNYLNYKKLITKIFY